MTAHPVTSTDAPRTRRESESMTAVARRLLRHATPWLLITMLVVAVTVRTVIGGFTTTDLIIAAVLIGLHPLTEWVIHVMVLHFRPVTLRGKKIDPLLAREHRRHHADPRDEDLTLIPLRSLIVIIPALAIGALIIAPRPALALTYLVTQAAIGVVYEWTHFLIHSDYRPKHAPYRALWRHHRLHHFKNENYWFGVTSPWGDNLLGTRPEANTVPTSPTAKTLGVGLG